MDIVGDLGGFAFRNLDEPCKNSFDDSEGNRYITCINADISDADSNLGIVTARGNWKGKTKGGLVRTCDNFKTFDRIGMPFGINAEIDKKLHEIENPNVNAGWVAVSPDGVNIVWSVADGIRLPVELVLVSNDGGHSFQKAGVFDLAGQPVETGYLKVFSDRSRKDLFYGFGGASEIYVSRDGGRNFYQKQPKEAFPVCDFGYIDTANKTEVRGEGGKTGIFYLALGDAGLYKLCYDTKTEEIHVKRLTDTGDACYRMGLGVIGEDRDYPILLPDTCPEETNVYDMRLTKHEDGYIYGVFCSESKDTTVNDLSAAVAAAGIVRTRDLRNWERLPNLVTLNSPQQRNVVLHPEFVDGKYAFYTRPMDDFIETGSGGGIGFGLCEDITHAVIDEEKMTSLRKYHTITEAKNGAGATPIKTDKGWIHIAHGVRNTAAGLRYVIYAFATDLNDPSKVIAEPSGLLIGPRGEERVGDVSNVVFTNGAIVNENNEVFIYYASSDTRMHVATTTVDKLVDYVFNTPQDPGRSVECVAQRCGLIEKNLEFLAKEDK